MIDVVVTDEFFEHKEGSNLFGVVYIDAGEFVFPTTEWSDFVENVLSAWTNELLRHEHDKMSHFTLYFMDGPYELDILKDGGGALAVRCVDHGRVKYETGCGYGDFLDAMGRALKSLNQILLAKQGWNPDGPFAPSIAHNAILMEKLVAAGKSHVFEK